jgi:hypothetical protein
VVAVFPPVITGIDPVDVAVEPDPVIMTDDDCRLLLSDVCAVFVVPVDPVSVVPPVCAAAEEDWASKALERFGSVVAVDAAALSITRRETARAVERSGVFRRSLMMTVITAYLSNGNTRPELRPRGSRGSAAKMGSFKAGDVWFVDFEQLFDVAGG